MSTHKEFAIGFVVVAVFVVGFAYRNDLQKISFARSSSFAQGISQTDFDVQIAVEDGMPDLLKHPQKFFSGREIVLINKSLVKNGDEENVRVMLQSSAVLSLHDAKTRAKLSSTPLTFSKKEPGVIEIPEKTLTGSYTIDFNDSGKQYSIPIVINGIDPNTQTGLEQSIISAEENLENSGRQSSTFSNTSDVQTLDPSITSISRLNCHCSWESVSAINPTDENYGYMVSLGGNDFNDPIVETTDGWKTSQVFSIGQHTNQPARIYDGDPKIAFDKDGRLIISSLFYTLGEPITGGLYIDSAPKNFPPQLTQQSLNEPPEGIDPVYWIIYDFPKIAIDNNIGSPYFGSKYLSVNGYYFYQTETWIEIGTAFLTLLNGTKDVKNVTGRGPAFSMGMGTKGEIYWSNHFKPNIYLHVSKDGGNTFIKNIVHTDSVLDYCSPRVSTLSQRAWYGAMETVNMAVAQNGRVYVVWSDYEKCVADSNFEMPTYAYNSDIYESYSDNSGTTWSTPVKISSDTSGGDQLFPSVAVDDAGVVYVAYFDHRNHPNQDNFDVYLARSYDGGKTFTKDVQINDISVPNTYGGRNPGDYFDMVSVGKTKIFVSYPCENPAYPNPGFPSDTCISTLTKDIAPPSSHTVTIKSAIAKDGYATATKSTTVGNWTNVGKDSAGIKKGYLYFDTSSIPTNAVVTKSTLSAYGHNFAGNTCQNVGNLNVYSCNYDPLTSGDFNSCVPGPTQNTGVSLDLAENGTKTSYVDIPVQFIRKASSTQLRLNSQSTTCNLGSSYSRICMDSSGSAGASGTWAKCYSGANRPTITITYTL